MIIVILTLYCLLLLSVVRDDVFVCDKSWHLVGVVDFYEKGKRVV